MYFFPQVYCVLSVYFVLKLIVFSSNFILFSKSIVFSFKFILSTWANTLMFHSMITLYCSDHITSQNISLQFCLCYKVAIHFQVYGGSPTSYASWTAVANSLSSNLPTHSASPSATSTTGFDHFLKLLCRYFSRF